jgi:hypothetical protein
MIFVSCNSGSQDEAEAQTVQNSSTSEETTTGGDPAFETIDNGNRLTENSLKSQLPIAIMGSQKSGESFYEENDLRGGHYSRVSQTYSNSSNQSFFYLDISDYADAQNYINSVQEGIRIQNFDFSTTTQNARGWYITESFESRGDDITARTLNVKNPRFTIELRAAPQLGNEVPSFESLMTALEQANLLELFELEIPQGEDEKVQVADKRNDLACGELLPVERVQSFCGIDGVEVNITSFEQQKNCNRLYAHPDNFGGLTFIVTQYSDAGMATRAVETKLNDNDLDSESISNLGEAASIVTIDEALFLSVAHQNYLIELRSSEGMGPAETASVCLDKEKLNILANDVIAQLP